MATVNSSWSSICQMQSVENEQEEEINFPPFAWRKNGQRNGKHYNRNSIGSSFEHRFVFTLAESALDACTHARSVSVCGRKPKGFSMEKLSRSIKTVSLSRPERGIEKTTHTHTAHTRDQKLSQNPFSVFSDKTKSEFRFSSFSIFVRTLDFRSGQMSLLTFNNLEINRLNRPTERRVKRGREMLYSGLCSVVLFRLHISTEKRVEFSIDNRDRKHAEEVVRHEMMNMKKRRLAKVSMKKFEALETRHGKMQNHFNWNRNGLSACSQTLNCYTFKNLQWIAI